MKCFLIFLLVLLGMVAKAVNPPYSAFDTNMFLVEPQIAYIGINTNLFPEIGSLTNLFDTNGAALYQGAQSTNYTQLVGQNGTNFAKLIGQNSTNFTSATSNALQAQISLAVTNYQTNVFVQNINGVSASIPTAGLYAWWRADMLTNQTLGSSVQNIPDYTGNPNNTLYPYTTTTFASTWNPTIMNGLPGFACTTGLGWTNGFLFPAGISNATMIVVYRDTVQSAGGDVVFEVGSAGFESVAYTSYTGNGYGQAIAGSCDNWFLNNDASIAYLYNKQNYQVQSSVLRISTNTLDPAIWGNGVQNLQAINSGGGMGHTVVMLTNTLGLCFGISGGNLAYRGYVGEVMLYTNALNLQQIGQVNNYIAAKYGSNNKNVIVTGDSQAIGVFTLQSSNTVNVLTRLLPDWECSNVGVSGRTSQQVWTNLYYTVLNQKARGGTAVFIFPDFNNAGSVANATNYVFADIAMCKTNGYIPFLITEWSSHVDEIGFPGYRTNYNNWIYTNWQNYGVQGIVDLATNPNIGPIGSWTNLQWFIATNVDAGVAHLNSNSYPAIVGPAIANELKCALYTYTGLLNGTNSHVPVAVTVGASPFSFTNTGPTDLECYFTDAAAYTVAKNGTTVFNSAIGNGYFLLSPTNILTITYLSTTPTFNTNSYQ